MEVTTERFIRKPLYVDAVRVKADNFEAVAAWCEGEIHKETEGPRTGKSYIRVRVQYPKSPRQSKAFIGDWVLYTETGYKVYTNPAFRKSFDEFEEPKVEAERPATAEEIREKLPNAQDRRPTAPPQDDRKTTHEPPLPEPPVIEPGADLGSTPQGEPIEVVEATPQAIAEVVNEQQPPDEEPIHLETKPYEETVRAQEEREEEPVVPYNETSPPVDQDPPGIIPVHPEHLADVPPVTEEPVSEEELVGGPVSQPEPISEQEPEDAAAGKRVLSEEEQRQMGPDAVREMLGTGDVILAQDLAA